MNAKMWSMKKEALVNELHELERRSAVLHVLGVQDGGAEWRALIRFDTLTLVRGPDGVVRCRGPVTAGIRYHERFLSQAPIPWEIVAILSPPFVFSPNINAAGALCLGHAPPAIRLTEMIHMCWAAITVNLRLVDTVEWHGLNPEAAAYVRANQHRFPLTECGLFEAAPMTVQEYAL
jgi:hypothetical protein